MPAQRTKTLDLPTPQNVGDWCRAHLKLPPGAFVSRALWEEASLNLVDWREFEGALQGADFLFLVRQNLSALGVAETLRSSAAFETEGARPYYRPFGGNATFWAELELRGDIERLGRAFVAARGLDYYAARLDALTAHERREISSAHERIEMLLRWPSGGLLAPRDEKFCASFSEILALHAQFLRGNGGARAHLCGADLREVSWPVGALRNADLRGAILRNFDLQNEDLSGADLRFADLVAVNFKGANLQNADLRGAKLHLAIFQNADLTGAKRDNPKWSVGELVDWDGRGVRGNLSPKFRIELDWCWLDLRGRSFENWSGGLRGGPCFRGSNLEGANLSGAHMTGADFREANLRGANLRFFSCPFGETHFAGADLTGADVWGADLRDANFEGAILEGVQNRDFAQWDEKPPRSGHFRGADFRGQNLYGRNFSGCDLRGANFFDSDLRETVFVGANLEGADLRGADLKDADFTGANLKNARYSRLKMRGSKRENQTPH